MSIYSDGSKYLKVVLFFGLLDTEFGFMVSFVDVVMHVNEEREETFSTATYLHEMRFFF